MAKKIDRDTDSDKKLAKRLGAKAYYGIKACGATFKLKAPAVWNEGWLPIVEAKRRGDDFVVQYECKKCGRLSPTRAYLCKPKDLKSGD